jgi:CBS domain-containing protein
LRRIFALLSDPTINQANIGKYIDDMRVMDVMISHPETLNDNVDIEEALQYMVDLGFRYMPVVSHFNEKIAMGFVDEREVALHVAHHLERIRREAEQKDMVFQQLLREPYGIGDIIDYR